MSILENSKINEPLGSSEETVETSRRSRDLTSNPHGFDETKIEVESKEAPDKFDLWKISTDIDPETGLDWDFLQIREYICENGPAKGLEPLYEYYINKFHKLDPWSVYLLTCSHFSMEELEGTPINRSYRRRLEANVKKLMKKRETDKNTPFNEFLYKNSRSFDV